MSDKTPNTGWLQQGKRLVIVVAVATVVVAGGAFGVQAFANSQTYKHMQFAASYGSAWHGGKDGGHHQSFSQLSDAEIDARIERIVKHIETINKVNKRNYSEYKKVNHSWTTLY